MTEKLVPYGKYVVARKWEEPERTEGGIYIPNSSHGYPIRGIVVSVGEGVALDIKEGDLIMHLMHSGQKVDIAGVEHRVMVEDEVIGKLVEE